MPDKWGHTPQHQWRECQ